MIKARILHVFVLLTSLFSFSYSFSQETTSEIQGIVTDTSGKGLPGATIIALNEPTAAKFTTTSRSDGHYNLANLRVGGPYTITISFVGYDDKKFENITLLLGQTFNADATLSNQQQTLADVVVATTRQNRIINNNRTGAQEIISRSQIERLPTINRSLQDFTKLEPTSNGLNFGGRNAQYNNVTVDGANFNNSFGLSSTLGGQTGSQPISLDAIEQIQVNLSPYDVRQGGFTGAGINTVTRSGTNQFRGTAYYYGKNENSQGYRVGSTEVPKTTIKYNLIGAALGGPIIKNKVFFFGSYEQVRQELPATSYIASDANHPVTPGSVSQANADSLNRLSTFLDSALGYQTGAYQGYTFKTQSDKVTAKIDWNISSQHTLTVKYNYLKSSADQPPSTSRNGFSGFVSGQSPGNLALPFQNAGYVINNNFNIFIAELNSRFSNRSVNKLQVGYTQLRDFRASKGNLALPLVDILSPSGNVTTSFGYETFTYNNKLNTDVFQASDIFTFYKGGHEITIGSQNYFRKYLNGFAPAYEGIYQFSSYQAFYNSVLYDSVATRFAKQSTATKDGSFPYAKAGVTELSLFAQDKWRIYKTFTLTYGLRVDYSDYTGTFDQNADFKALTFANDTHYDVGHKPKSRPLFSPRIGFNWDALGDQSLQVRGGAGVFSGPPPFVWISNQASNNGVQFSQAVYNNNKVFNPDPNSYSTTGAVNTAYAINVTDKNFKYPTVLKSSLAVDKRFKNNLILTLEGSYSKDINAVYYSNANLNQNDTNTIALAMPISRDRYGANGNNKIYSGAGGVSTTNPNLSNVIVMDNSDKGYTYSITARAQKTFKDLFLSVAYTYAQAKNTSEFGSTAGGLWSSRAVQGNPNSDNLANAGWYQPHRVVAFASYRFTYAKYLATSFGLYFEGAPAGVTSYVYNGDLNNDGNNGNDLIYIPKSASEINLVKSGSGGLGTNTSSDPRTAAQIYGQLNAFINQDRYLSQHRGEVAKANAVVLPYFKRLDANITQDFSVKTGTERHTLRISLDVLNVGNLIYKYWGLVRTPVLTNFLRYEGLAADGKTPSFSFTYQDATNQVPLTNSFSNSTAIGSRWQMQFGIRYLFN